jgi:hypothetical protein
MSSESKFGLPHGYRPYRCTCCGHEKKIGTNHTDRCADYCHGCSWKVSAYPIAMIVADRAYRMFEYVAPDGEPVQEKTEDPIER